MSDEPRDKTPLKLVDLSARKTAEEDEDKEKHKGDPSKYTVNELMTIARENNWTLMNIGQYANSDDRGTKGWWGLRDQKDLDNLKPEQIEELIGVIQQNPKTK